MIARNMTMSVLGGSLLMFGVAVGCGERTGVPGPSPSAPLPASTGEQEEGKTTAEELGIELHVPEVAPIPAATTEPAIEEPSFEPELFEVDGISLGRLVIATGVEGREPVGAGTSFEPGQRIYAFLEARNATDEDAELYLTFEGPGGASVGHVSLDVPARSPRWRTWGYSRVVNEPGEWEALVTTIDGQEIGRARFLIGG